VSLGRPGIRGHARLSDVLCFRVSAASLTAMASLGGLPVRASRAIVRAGLPRLTGPVPHWRRSGVWAVLPASARFCTGASGTGGSQGSASSSDAGKGKSSSAGAGPNESESDKRKKETGEYDTQDAYKRVGNPISWANPTGGGTIEDNSSNKWKYVMPIGVSGILILCLWSRRKNMRKEQEEQMIGSPQFSSPDTSNFRYTPPPPPSSSAEGNDEEYDQTGPSFSSFGGSGSFSSPPQSETGIRI